MGPWLYKKGPKSSISITGKGCRSAIGSSEQQDWETRFASHLRMVPMVELTPAALRDPANNEENIIYSIPFGGKQ